MGEENQQDIVKCGYVTIAGRPNVGKSTLLNAVLGQKVSIVTRKPQTTRDRILAVHNTDDRQVIFLDTPGIHRPQDGLGHYMNEAANNAILEADVCLWLIDATDRKRGEGLSREERDIARRLQQTGIPVVIALNKVDRMEPKERILPLLQEIHAMDIAREIVPVSALTGDGVDTLMSLVVAMLPEGPRLFPRDMLSDRADRFFVAELVREAIMDITHKEVPYRTAVVIDQFKEQPAGTEIFASIHVETTGQKAIIIGKNGEKITEIRERARTQAAELLGCPVSLRLHVDVSPDWSTNPAGLRKMGYE